jgi:hypothetical protein
VSCFAFKFLARGAVGPVSGFVWPAPKPGRPGSWIEAREPLHLCASGIHACAVQQLAHWLHEELWVVELDGQLVAGHDSVVAERGRLTRQVEAWVGGGAARFAKAARDHAAELAAGATPELQAQLKMYVADASYHLPHGATALAAFCAAMTVARLHGGGSHFDEAGYREERLWQSKFIENDLQLTLPAN